MDDKPMRFSGFERTAGRQARRPEGAKRGRQALEVQAERLAQSVYFSRIHMAQNACVGREFYQALQFLDECEPPRREWEWHYLRRLATPMIDRTVQTQLREVYSAEISRDCRTAVATTGRNVYVVDLETGSAQSIARVESDVGVISSPYGTQVLVKSSPPVLGRAGLGRSSSTTLVRLAGL